ncbi:hypothetical protein TNCV_1667131 [Trichonephila clavipes]|nr:hypothetical protein TNCV_1667131 [Trichonephila clavipes]
MMAVYGDTRVSKPTVTRLARMFSDCRQETRDLPWPGQAHKVVTEKLIMHIDTAIKGNRHRYIRDVTHEFNVPIGYVRN